MALTGTTGDKRGGRRSRRPRNRLAADETFIKWLDGKLRRLYEAELAEPIPEEMLRLLNTLDVGEDEGSK